jgi:hypothetical protein
VQPKYALCAHVTTPEQEVDPQPDPPRKFLHPEKAARLVQEVKRRGDAPSPAPRPSASAPPARRRRRQRLTKRPTQLVVRTVLASLGGAADFGQLLAAEVHRRGLDLARRKAYVADGLPYNWTIWETHFRDLGFVPILDFLHLLTYLYGAAQAAGGGPQRPWERYCEWLTWAWQGQRERLLFQLQAQAQRLRETAKQDRAAQARLEVLETACHYVFNNLVRMNYPLYRKLGLPISSAPMESVVKRFNQRVKGTEKFWTRQGLEAVLQVRAAYLSEDGRAERYWNMPRPRYRAVGRNRLALAS